MENGVKPVLWIVIPCFNEEEVLPKTAPLFKKELELLQGKGMISDESRILFVNDGSKDRTWEIICDFSQREKAYIGISQSRNRGHQSSLLAGLMEAKDKCDITISIDCDGQDDIGVMEQMVKAYLDGCDLVYGVRASRKTDSWMKRFSAESYYKLLAVLGADIVFNHADYRLVSRRVLQHFADFEEVNIFLRGMFPLVGFKSTSVYYERTERIAGKSHYSLTKMLSLAFDGITSLSIRPITLIVQIGVGISMISFIGIVWAVIQSFMGNTVAGWASIICIICFLSGVQLLSIGIIGEYVGKTYLEAKHRPRYIISEKTGSEFDKCDANDRKSERTE